MAGVDNTFEAMDFTLASVAFWGRFFWRAVRRACAFLRLPARWRRLRALEVVAECVVWAAVSVIGGGGNIAMRSGE